MSSIKHNICLIRWNDTKELENVDIQVGEPFDYDDDDVFFYCNTDSEFEHLQKENNGEDFVVEKVLSVCDH